MSRPPHPTCPCLACVTARRQATAVAAGEPLPKPEPIDIAAATVARLVQLNLYGLLSVDMLAKIGDLVLAEHGIKPPADADPTPLAAVGLPATPPAAVAPEPRTRSLWGTLAAIAAVVAALVRQLP